LFSAARRPLGLTRFPSSAAAAPLKNNNAALAQFPPGCHGVLGANNVRIHNHGEGGQREAFHNLICCLQDCWSFCKQIHFPTGASEQFSNDVRSFEAATKETNRHGLTLAVGLAASVRNVFSFPQLQFPPPRLSTNGNASVILKRPPSNTALHAQLVMELGGLAERFLRDQIASHLPCCFDRDGRATRNPPWVARFAIHGGGVCPECEKLRKKNPQRDFGASLNMP
jgi:hypothetical protein